MTDRLFQFTGASKPRLLDHHEDAPTHAPMKAGIRPVDRRAPSTDQKKVRHQQRKTAGFGAPGDPTEYGYGGDHCPHCGNDWKQPHDGDCLRLTNPARASALEAEGEVALNAENARYEKEHYPDGRPCAVCNGDEPDCRHCGGTGKVGPFYQGSKDGSMWDDLESGDSSTLKEADFSWYVKNKPGDIADSSGQGKSGLPDANEAEKADCGAKDNGLVCVRPKGHGGVHDYQPVQGETQKAARFVMPPKTAAAHEDWSGGWARDVPETNADGGPSVWGTRILPDGTEVKLFRGPNNHVRFYDAQGNQHGEEQANVAPAFAYAEEHGWHDPNSVRNHWNPIGASKTASGQFLFHYDSSQPGGVRRVDKPWRTKACSPGGNGDCTGYSDDESKECECRCHGEEAMDMLMGIRVEDMQSFHEEHIWPRGMPSFMGRKIAVSQEVTCNSCGGSFTNTSKSLGAENCPVCGSSDLKRAAIKVAAQPSDVCPKCGKSISPKQTELDDGSGYLLKAKCSCGWKGKKYRRKESRKTAAGGYWITNGTTIVGEADSQEEASAKMDEVGGVGIFPKSDFSGEIGGTYKYTPSEDSAAANFVRDFFLERKGRVSGREVDSTFNPVAKRALQRLVEKGDIVRKGQDFEWPFQMSMRSSKMAGNDEPWENWRRIVAHGYHSLMGSYIESDFPEVTPRQVYETGMGAAGAIKYLCAKHGKPVSVMDAMQAEDKAGQHLQLWSSKQGARSDYDHWNEDADHVWWQEEGRHPEEPPDPYDDDRGWNDYDESDDDDDVDDDINPNTGDPRIPEHQLSAARKESKMNPSQREAQILQAMAKATPAEQKDLAIELEGLRSDMRAHAQAERDLDWSSGVIRDTLTPVATHQANSSATDWIADIGIESSYTDALDHQVRAEATLWYQRTGSEVAEYDPEEFLEQAMGMARRTASLHNDITGRAERSFVEHACHLADIQVTYDDADGGKDNWPLNPQAVPVPSNWPITSPEGVTTGDSQDLAEIPAVAASISGSMWEGIERTASPGPGEADDSGQGVSSLPAEIPLEGHEDVLDNFQPPVAPVNEGIAFQEPTSADAPIIQENMQDPPETSGGGGNAGDIADPSGQGVSGLPTPNAVKARRAALRREGKDGDTGKCAICGKDIEQQDYAWYHLSKDGPVNWDEHGPETYPAPSSTASRKTADDNGGAQTCETCGDTITRDPEGESPRTYHHTNGTSHDHEAKPKGGGAEASRRTASEPIADPSGQGVSSLPQVDESAPEVMWPWEMDQNTPGSGAADVNAVPTPGQQVADYPQPKGATLHEAAKCAACNNGNHTGSNGTAGCKGGSCTCSCRKTSSLTPEQATFRARVQASLRG